MVIDLLAHLMQLVKTENGRKYYHDVLVGVFQLISTKKTVSNEFHLESIHEVTLNLIFISTKF